MASAASVRNLTPQQAALAKVTGLARHRVVLLTVWRVFMDLLICVCSVYANGEYNTNDRFKTAPDPYAINLKSFFILKIILGFLIWLPLNLFVVASGALVFQHYRHRFKLWLVFVFLDTIVNAIGLDLWFKAKELDGGVELAFGANDFPADYKAVWFLSIFSYLGSIIVSHVSLVPVYFAWRKLIVITRVAALFFQVRSPCEATPMPTKIAPQ